MNVTILLYFAAFVCFLLATFGAKPSISWRDAAFACIVLSLIVR